MYEKDRRVCLKGRKRETERESERDSKIERAKECITLTRTRIYDIYRSEYIINTGTSVTLHIHIIYEYVLRVKKKKSRKQETS